MLGARATNIGRHGDICAGLTTKYERLRAALETVRGLLSLPALGEMEA
jgi:hypothetical protein